MSETTPSARFSWHAEAGEVGYETVAGVVKETLDSV